MSLNPTEFRGNPMGDPQRTTKIEIYLDEEQDSLVNEALDKSGEATYSAFAEKAVMDAAKKYAEMK
tara:strand:- start:1389 stop:1586 length:198 start_codon:yes stop_codon:yes gene_type:complete